MNKTWLLIGVIAVLGAMAMIIIGNSDSRPKTTPPVQEQPVAQTPIDSHQHPHSHDNKTIPAYFEQAPSRASLGPTLEPQQFTGKVREAYLAVRAIPQTIAQMPCYCHCDRGMGHKSLYSCFEDDHASHCAVCVNEALLALKLEKEQKLTPAQIRDRIVAEFGQY
ncbi:MAG TPA: CYCXC family (seleno)protein [Pyrinomonadaceae bacterium]|nr:CYCXC family (seleno)protein [Pyrinomonadaceae bacterium]